LNGENARECGGRLSVRNVPAWVNCYIGSIPIACATFRRQWVGIFWRSIA
jgi:hypothetical protein